MSKLDASLFALILFSLPAFAHRSTDWSQDKAAYEYTRKNAGRIWIAPPDVLAQNFENVTIDPELLRAKLTEILAVATERRSESGREAIRQYLAAQYASLGYATSVHEYGRGKNFIAEKRGTSKPNEVIILSAHIDSVGNAGANDDASGVAATLAIAHALQGRSFARTIRVLGFDQEELGLVGSRAYATALSGPDTIVGNIQLDMVGTNSRNDGMFHLVDCDRAESRFLSDMIMGAISANQISLSRSPTCTNRSDHNSFWRVGIPAVALAENFFGGDSDVCYHSRCDVLDARINFDYMAKITRAVASATINLLEPSAVLGKNRSAATHIPWLALRPERLACDSGVGPRALGKATPPLRL